MDITKRIVTCVFLVLGSLSMIARPVDAQVMSFSVYNDLGVSGDYVVAVATVMDNSSGCSHWSYYTTVGIVSPTNRTGSSQSMGLYGTTSLSINSEDGDFASWVTGAYSCSCIHGGQGGFGGPSAGIGIESFTALFQKSHYSQSIGKWVYNAVALLCNGKCQPSQWCSTQECNWLYIKGYKASTAAASYCQPTPPFPRCSESEPTCKQRFGAVIWNPDNECN